MIHHLDGFKKIAFKRLCAWLGVIGIVVFRFGLLSKPLKGMLDQISNAIAVGSRNRIWLAQPKLVKLSNRTTVRHPFGLVDAQDRALTEFTKQAANVMVVSV